VSGSRRGDLPGLDLAALSRWLDVELPGSRVGDLRAELVAGGRSNLTYRLDDDAHTWVLRRPPLGHVLATAHDMAREHRVIGALAGSAVPVPEPVALCARAEGSPLGAPFYLMQRVEGLVLRSTADLDQVPAPDRHALGLRMIDTLADLHAVEPAAVGLADFGRPDGFLARQVRRWGAQLDASRSRDLLGVDELREGLAASVPASRRASVVHGDYRLDNLVVTPGGWDVAAVLDWEMSTLGDPLTDLGLLLAYTQGLSDPGNPVAQPVDPSVGFPSGDEYVARYAARSGLAEDDLAGLPWCTALGFFKIAVILEGIHYRFVRGQTVGAGFDRIGGLVPGLVERGRAALSRARRAGAAERHLPTGP
jgi:aminoglycoside phosphotransferase (APT) family kinase protein